MGTLASLRLLVELSLRSLATHRLKTVIVGAILLLGTFVLAFATSMLNNVENAMERSITGSLIGHAQVVSKDAVDDLAFFGPNANGVQDLSIIKDFKKAREVLEKLPEVKAVVPMGRDTGQVVRGGNLLDRTLSDLRRELKEGDAAHVDKTVARVRQLAELVKTEQTNRRELAADTAAVDANLAIAERVASDAFWAEFKADPLPALDWLDAKFAPLESDEQSLFLAYIGTDVERFSANFDAFQMVRGEKMPPGERGLLVGQEFLERVAKNFIARELDLVANARNQDGKTIAGDTTTGEKAKRIGRQYKRIVYELGPDESALVEKDLRAFFALPEAGVGDLVQKLLTLDDGNFDAHYKAFYDFVAPRVRLYAVNVGETVTVRVFTRTGYTRALNLKVWGVFGFRGLDGSLIASAYNIIDLMSFRDLYGLMTPERRAELDAIKANVGVKDVSAQDAEASLFGDDTTLEVAGEAVKVEEADVAATQQAAEAAPKRAATQDDIDDGVVVNAAIVLKDGSRLREGIDAVLKAADANGLELKAYDWEQASGIIGQLIWTLRVVLYVAFIILLVVALAIINNSLIMATMNRIQEIGTFRAIGAQKGFIVGMLVVETAVLASIACGAGLGLAAGLLHLIGTNGLSANGNEMLIVLFGGPKLYPFATTASILTALASVGLVSLGATLYPAYLATTVQPVVAMQNRE